METTITSSSEPERGWIEVSLWKAREDYFAFIGRVCALGHDMIPNLDTSTTAAPHILGHAHICADCGVVTGLLASDAKTIDMFSRMLFDYCPKVRIGADGLLHTRGLIGEMPTPKLSKDANIQYLEHVTRTYADGVTPKRYKIISVKLWKRKPWKVRIRARFGWYENIEITERDLQYFRIAG